MTEQEVKDYFEFYKCKGCGTDLKVHFNDDGEAMRFYCPSDSCEMFIREKASAWLEEFGYGTATANIISSAISKVKEKHIVHVLMSMQEKVSLEGFLRMSFIYGVNRDKILIMIKASVTGKTNLDDIMYDIRSKYGIFQSVMPFYEQYKDHITIPTYAKVGKIINIMIHGSIHLEGGLDRKKFAIGLTALTDGYITVKETGPRSTGVYALVTESPQDSDKKCEIARENPKIKVMTPREFVEEFILTYLRGVDINEFKRVHGV